MYYSYHISNDNMCISNQCDNVNSHLAILSDEYVLHTSCVL